MSLMVRGGFSVVAAAPLRRIALGCALASLLTASEAFPFDVSLMRLSANSSSYTDQPVGDRPWLILGSGVHFAYEQVFLRTDHQMVWLEPLVPDGRPWPRRARFESGPMGPEPDRIHLDTRNAQLPSISYRGLLRPQRMYIERGEVTPSASGSQVSYQVRLLGVGWSLGQIRVPEQLGTQRRRRAPAAAEAAGTPSASAAMRWVPLVSWAERIEITLDCAVDERGNLAEPSLRRLEIHAPSTGEALAEVRFYDTGSPLRMQGRRFRFHFDETGRYSGYDTGEGDGAFAVAGLPLGSQPPVADPFGRLLLPLPEAMTLEPAFEPLLAPTPLPSATASLGN